MDSWIYKRVGGYRAPQYDLYEDETQNKQIFTQLAEDLEPMTEIRDHDIQAEILLPRRTRWQGAM